MRIRSFIVLILVAVLLFWSWPAQNVRAATLIVTNLNDSGAGSLRDAIDYANDGDTITFQNGLNGTILLYGTLWVTANLNIVGPGPSVITLDGNDGGGINDTNEGYSIFYINSYTTVNISGLTLQNATVYVKGAAIYDDTATLNVDNCVFKGNKTYTGDGGGAGIYSHAGSLTVNHSTFSNNISEWGIGAGIFSDGGLGGTSSTLTVSNSVFISNTIGDSGGGIGAWGNSTITVSNSTFYGNSASVGGAIGTMWSNTALTVLDSTFKGNSSSGSAEGSLVGGAIHVDIGDHATLTIGNSIVAGNTSSTGPADVNGPLTSLGYNLIGSGSGVTGWVASDQLNTDPLLNTLADNGGPTETMSLQVNSPAIGMGDCSLGTPVTTDQRGYARKTPLCDVGALETAYNPMVYNTHDHGGGSLRYVVTDAPPSGTTITFDPGYFNGYQRTITLTGGGLTFPGNLTILGPGPDDLTVDGNNAATVFTVNSGSTSAISGLNIQHGSGGNNGGGIDNAGTLSLSNCAFTSNTANTGGGLKNHGGSATITGCTFSGNSATTGYGGGAYTNGPLTISNSTFSGNSANAYGGALYVNSVGTLTVGNSTIAGNSTLGHGGGIANYNGTTNFNLGSSIVSGNTAGIDGPDISGAVTSLGSNLVGDTAGATGLISSDQQNVNPLLGTLNYNGGSTMTMPLQTESPAIGMGNCNLPSPSSPVTTDQRTVARKTPACDVGAYEATYDPVVRNDHDSGGGSLRYAVTDAPVGKTITFDPTVFNTPQVITLTGGMVTVARNMTIQGPGAGFAAVDGNAAGRIFTINSEVTASISGLTVQNGSTTSGGGLFNNGTLTLSNMAFSGNHATNGGGIYASAGTINVYDSTLSGNTAIADGGGIYVHAGSTVHLVTSTVGGNSANFGGGIYNGGSATLMIMNSTISGNGVSYPLIGSGGGGGIYTSSSFSLGSSVVAGNTLFHIGIHPSDINGTVTSMGYNLIGDTSGATGLVSSDLQNVDPRLGTLGLYGGSTQVFPLLPGSPAIDAGSNATCPALDQRSVNRPQGATCDIGAFESQPFTLTITGGNNQTALINTAFADPLSVSVGGTNGDPVDGGVITFSVPGSGASAALASNPVTISGGAVSDVATANGTTGSYDVSANASGVVTPAAFHLTNSLTLPSPTRTPTATPTATLTVTATYTPTLTRTPTVTYTPTTSRTATRTATVTYTPTTSRTATRTATVTYTPTTSRTPTPTNTPTLTATLSTGHSIFLPLVIKGGAASAPAASQGGNDAPAFTTAWNLITGLETFFKGAAFLRAAQVIFKLLMR